MLSRRIGFTTAFCLYGLAAFACWPFSLFAEQNWPQWRGPAGQGHAEAIDLPLTWSETEHVTWKTPLPGRGWSSPAIEGQQIWLTTAVESDATPEDKAKNANPQPQTISGRLSLRAQGVDKASGKLLHDVELLTEDKPDPIHTLNSFASPSPILENGKLYCHFGTNGTACLDTRTAKVLWTNRSLRIKHENGAGSTPILWRDFLIFHCDGSDQQYLVALRKSTGEVAWKTNRSGELRPDPQQKKSYGTPLVVDVAGKPQLISPASDWLYAYDPATGEELWKLNYGVLGYSVVPRPVAAHGLLFVCTSFNKSELLAVRYDGRGETNAPHIAWRHKKQVSSKPSPVVVGDEIYFVSDGGVASCLDAKTGKEHWSERLGGNFSASPLFADGRLYFFNQEGVTTVLEPGTTFKTLVQNKLDGRFMASAAALDRALYLRTDQALYRIESR